MNTDKYLVFDLETTGLPVKHYDGYTRRYAPYTDNPSYDTSRIVQIAWVVITIDGEILDDGNFTIKRDGFDIPLVASNIHGITNERSDAEGVDIINALIAFETSLDMCETLVAHNIQFDYNILLNHAYRYSCDGLIAKLQGKRLFCTMEASVDLSASRDGKYLSLGKLYRHYFNEDITEPHRAENDVDACAECFLQMMIVTLSHNPVSSTGL